MTLAGVTSCGGSEPPLGSLTVAGRPIVDGGWVPVTPGQPGDFAAFLINSSNAQVRLESATLVPVQGQTRARLAHIAITLNHDYVASGRGWPPGVAVRSFKGALIPHGQTDIQFGITGETVGRAYSTAGLRIGYQYRGHAYYFMLWADATICVTRRTQVESSATACQVTAGRIYRQVAHSAGANQ
jgi:hypothetical protein